MNKQLVRDMLGGAAIAVLYLPLSQLHEIIWMKTVSGVPAFFWVLMLLLYAAAACMFLYSSSVRIAVGRMILSVPFTVLFQWILLAVHILDRASDWLYSGAPPEGLEAARILRMLMVYAAVWFGAVVGIVLTGRVRNEKAQAVLAQVHHIVMPVLSVLIVGSIFVLYCMIPD